jgi:hypothetical protein
MAARSLVEPSVGRRVHLVELVEDRVRGLVGEVVDDILRIRTMTTEETSRRLTNSPHNQNLARWSCQ